MTYLVREDDGAVAVGLEVHPDVEVEGRVVEVLHACRHARYGNVLKLGGKTAPSLLQHVTLQKRIPIYDGTRRSWMLIFLYD